MMFAEKINHNNNLCWFVFISYSMEKENKTQSLISKINANVFMIIKMETLLKDNPPLFRETHIRSLFCVL